MATQNNRPLSPHLQVYRLPLTGLISITHRMTGVLLALCMVLVLALLASLSFGEQSYLAVQTFIKLWPVQVVYWGIIYSLIFHLCHGIRHLIWDVGKSFSTDQLNKYALIELLATIILTIATFLFI